MVEGDSAWITRKNRFEKIFGNATSAINGSQRHQVIGTADGTFLGNLSVTVGRAGKSNRMMQAGRQGDHSPRSGDLTVFPTFKRDMKLGMAHGEGGTFRLQALGNCFLNVGKSVDMSISQGLDINSGEDIDIQSGKSVHLCGQSSLTCETPNTLTLSAGKMLALSCGAARIVLHANGAVVIDGASISGLAAGNIRLKANKIDLN